MNVISPSVKFSAIYRVDNDDTKLASRAIAQKLSDEGIHALTIHSSNDRPDNYTNLVITGDEYQELTSLENQMANTLKEIRTTSSARKLMVELAKRFEKAIESMSNKDHPKSIWLDNKSDSYKGIAGTILSLSNNPLDHGITQELEILFDGPLFDGTLVNRLFVREPDPPGSASYIEVMPRK